MPSSVALSTSSVFWYCSSTFFYCLNCVLCIWVVVLLLLRFFIFFYMLLLMLLLQKTNKIIHNCIVHGIYWQQGNRWRWVFFTKENLLVQKAAAIYLQHLSAHWNVRNSNSSKPKCMAEKKGQKELSPWYVVIERMATKTTESSKTKKKNMYPFPLW